MNNENKSMESIKTVAKKIIKFKDLEGKFIHVTVGSSDVPAMPEQITEIQDKMEDMFKENEINCLAFVTHHAVSINFVEAEK